MVHGIPVRFDETTLGRIAIEVISRIASWQAMVREPGILPIFWKQKFPENCVLRPTPYLNKFLPLMLFFSFDPYSRTLYYCVNHV